MITLPLLTLVSISKEAGDYAAGCQAGETWPLDQEPPAPDGLFDAWTLPYATGVHITLNARKKDLIASIESESS